MQFRERSEFSLQPLNGHGGINGSNVVPSKVTDWSQIKHSPPMQPDMGANTHTHTHTHTHTRTHTHFCYFQY